MEIQERLPTDNIVLRSLSDSRRRRILLLLSDRSSPVDLDELATHLAADREDKPLVEVTGDEVARRRTDLVHRQLPQLDAAGLVTWAPSEETVTTTNHPALSDPKLRRILDAAADDLDAVLAALAHERHRVVLSVLTDHEGTLERSELSRRVFARADDAPADARQTDVPAELPVTLHHLDLPALDQAGLVSYDRDEGTVAYEGHPALDDEWLDARPDETPRAILPAAHRSDALWTIEGRDNVIARGQSLFEQAEDELFLLFTTDGLLEDGCIRRLQAAIDRGVDVYLGSQTPAVRDLVRERLPEAVIWEPQLDWLNLPPEYERVGRLVFADREAIMLATLGDETDTGTYAETAITGAGTDNPLVVLVRDMLGSRLDHLDAQSEDFLAEIPL